MSRSEKLPALYLISDRHKNAPNLNFWETLEGLLAAGIGMFQLREKDLSAAQLYPLARQARELTKRYNALLLINDRVDVALAVKADGVHLGGHSLPPQVVRALAGENFLIGASTHAIGEIAAAHTLGADFVTFGPIFHTPSKSGMGDPLGPEMLQDIAQAAFPVYALGGIKPDNLSLLAENGATRVAAISSLLEAADPVKTVEFFNRSLKY
jgi:thiamine-phosphate pyrophosphorylase